MAEQILVIDDEVLIAKSIERALVKVGYDVTTVYDKDGFIGSLNKSPYELIIMDLNMKDLTEGDIRREIAQTSPNAKFLIISGSNYHESENFLQKPFQISELRQMVRKLLDSN